MRFRTTSTHGFKAVYSEYGDIEKWTPKFLERLHATGPRFIADLREREHNMVIDRAEKKRLVGRVVAVGGHIIVPLIDDYEEWVGSGRPKTRKRLPKPVTALQLLARGTAVEQLVRREDYFLLRHVNPYISQLEDHDGKPVSLVAKRDGYTPRALTKVLVEKIADVRFYPGRVIVYDPKLKRAARALPFGFENYVEIRDLHDLLSARLLGPV